MSFLTDNPEIMIEALAILVRRAGGSVTITGDEAPGPFNLLSRWDGNKLYLALDETVTPADVLLMQAQEKALAAHMLDVDSKVS